MDGTTVAADETLEELFGSENARSAWCREREWAGGTLAVSVGAGALRWRSVEGPVGLRLQFLGWELDLESVEQLRELALTLPGVLPAGVVVDARGEVEVPPLAPQLVNEEQVVWRITSAVSLGHRECSDVRFGFDEPIVDKQLFIPPEDLWALAMTLTGVLVWQEELDAVCAGAARERRAELEGGVSP